MNPAKLFRFLSEFLMLLLGALLILLALTGHVGRPGRPTTFLLLGAVLLYWGLRNWMRGKQDESRFMRIVQAVSLCLLGAAALAIPLAPVGYTALILAAAGASLVLRGLLASVYLLRRA